MSNDDRRAWALESVRDLRELGFFAAFGSDEEVLEYVVEESGDLPSPLDHPDLPHYADFSLLRLDENRVWWEDTEADVMPRNQVYANEVIPAWARIARTIAEVRDLAEHWPEPEEGFVRITLLLNGKPVELHAEIDNDWLDMRVLVAFDQALGDRPARLHLVHTGDQSAFVVALRKDEADRLTRDRGWRFVYPECSPSGARRSDRSTPRPPRR